MATIRPVLVIDDDTELCELLNAYLGRTDFQVTAVHDGENGIKSALAGNFDLIILDVMLPGANGFDVLRKIRAESNTPVIMLTARDEDVDRIVGLELGADDYLPKPFNPRELVARMEAILRRSTSNSDSNPNTDLLQVGDLQIDDGTREVTCKGIQIDLTTTEFAILKILVGAAGNVVKREELSAKALGRNLTRFDRSIDVHVSKLRKKLGGTSDPDGRIRTIRGIGYQYICSRSET
jgi:two-component system response regulator CpxR